MHLNGRQLGEYHQRFFPLCLPKLISLSRIIGEFAAAGVRSTAGTFIGAAFSAKKTTDKPRLDVVRNLQI